ncbi:MAG: DoxX family protein [Actinomycetota bacterium]|nr:DoxX family protein [Actinomycetota bacterium]
MARLALPDIPDADRLAALAIRGVVGPVMAYHGYQKLTRPGGAGAFADSVSQLEAFGMGLPRLAGYIVVAIELIGGLCILAGFLTRIWSLLLAVQMFSIPFVVKSQVGLIAPEGGGTGFELDLLIGVCAVALVLMGPGALALDEVLGVEGARREAAGARGTRPARGH